MNTLFNEWLLDMCAVGMAFALLAGTLTVAVFIFVIITKTIE